MIPSYDSPLWYKIFVELLVYGAFVFAVWDLTSPYFMLSICVWMLKDYLSYRDVTGILKHFSRELDKLDDLNAE